MPKGAIVLVPFPFTDLSGHKVRPALVVYASPKGEDCIVVFISSAPRRATLYDVQVNASRSNGLKINSIIRVDKIATLQKKVVLGQLGMLESPLFEKVAEKLKRLLDL